MNDKLDSLLALDELKNGLVGHCKSSYLKDKPKELEGVLEVYKRKYKLIKKDLENYQEAKPILDTLKELLKNCKIEFSPYDEDDYMSIITINGLFLQEVRFAVPCDLAVAIKRWLGYE